MLYLALAVIGFALAWGSQRSFLWALGAPIAALGVSVVLEQWAPLMPMWGDAATIVWVGGLLAGTGALVTQGMLGGTEPRPTRSPRAVMVRPVPCVGESQLPECA